MYCAAKSRRAPCWWGALNSRLKHGPSTEDTSIVAGQRGPEPSGCLCACVFARARACAMSFVPQSTRQLFPLSLGRLPIDGDSCLSLFLWRERRIADKPAQLFFYGPTIGRRAHWSTQHTLIDGHIPSSQVKCSAFIRVLISFSPHSCSLKGRSLLHRSAHMLSASSPPSGCQ